MKPPRVNLDSDLVRFSRAGDAFHYRWAARRCLRMVDPRYPVSAITIEASLESKLAAECIIDLAEYDGSEANCVKIHYVQLKHSTVRKNKLLGLREIGGTLAAFAQRHSAHMTADPTNETKKTISFSLVSNRYLRPRLREALEAIKQGAPISAIQRRQLEKLTQLSGDSFRTFFNSMSVVDGEGDYIVQHERLHGELADYLAGFVESDEVDKIVNLVNVRALPHQAKNRRKGEILREDVLQRLGITSERDLFPAPREFEDLPHIIRREQHDELMRHILAATTPVIIHAAGGVGKSVVARQIAGSLPKGSLGIVYDCFGSGKYRSPSEPRHHAGQALLQIANELAAAGYCHMLIGHAGTPPAALFRGFLLRLRESVRALREIESTALLVILIDAADNAEMAAQENGDQCFAHGLLRETLPAGCQLVALCRTERRELLRPESTVQQFLLTPFSENETAAHLRSRFNGAANDDVREFFRLTGGNPRVQATAMGSGGRTIDEILENLGPAVTTVDAQIGAQLRSAVARIKDRYTSDVSKQIDAICIGLANLPPFIPVSVLAKAAQVEESAIHSFVSDLGYPLWHSDSSVMFRDEPTETWFREQFATHAEQTKGYVTILEPLAKEFPYVAKALPQLLLKSEQYTRLIALALSNDLLPEDNPIDARNIRVYRLQFAFRAALRLSRTADAAQLAFRAGEEVAGDQRQLILLSQHADLVAPLLDPSRVQELAYGQLLSGDWQGSRNVYSASLLSSIADFKGEARGYFRAARKWLTIYFEERAKRDQFDQIGEQLKDADLAEMAWAKYNLEGIEALATFLVGWKPTEVVFRLSRLIFRRLVDTARFHEIDELAMCGRKRAYLVLAAAGELEPVAKFPPAESLKPTLDLLARNGLKKPPAHSIDHFPTYAVVSFCEACAARRLPTVKILAVLNHYTASHATRSVGDNYDDGARTTFARGVALRAVLMGVAQPDPKSLLQPEESDPKRHSHDESEKRNLLEVLGGLLPWYYLRSQLVAGDPAALGADLEKVRAVSKSALSTRYRTHDHLPYEVSAVWFGVLALKANVTAQELEQFRMKVVVRASKKFRLLDRLSALHTACRLMHLTPLRSALEQSCLATIEPSSSESPEERADSYIQMARAVFVVSLSDASAYFVRAIDAVSKFGDEIVPRWNAMVEIARRVAEGERSSDETAYRFFKCAEMVGDSVAREKYWSRGDVFRVGVRLHPPSAFAAVSRWRDREVGWFNRPMQALATDAVSSGQVAALPGWCLSGFRACNAEVEFTSVCLRCEPSQFNRQWILDAAIRDMELAGSKREDWIALQAVAEELGLNQARLAPLLTVHLVLPTAITSSAETNPNRTFRQLLSPEDWDAIFLEIDVLTDAGIARAESLYRQKDSWRDFQEFWAELLRRVPIGREIEFLGIIPTAPSIDTFDIRYLLISLRTHWLQKASIKAAWPRFLGMIGKRYAAELAGGHLEYWTGQGPIAEADIPLIKAGVVQGLAESLNLVDALTFFGFIESVAPDLTCVEASNLLDYAMARFELHVERDFGDGPWASWLQTPSNTSDAMAGFIWSALGSPLSATRWQAMHCVRRLVEAKCDNELNYLFDWLQRDAVGAFGSHRFPFYRLHARQYFLIALARTTRDTPERLVRHAGIMERLALKGMPHILIQKTAADIALRIEQAKPGTYSNEVVHTLQITGRSPFPSKEVDGYSYVTDSPWHLDRQTDTTLKLHFGIDFDEYWFNYLADVFGLPKQQAIDLGREAAVAYLAVNKSDQHQEDPRNHLWNGRDYNERGTYHSHGGYPVNDNYYFYYSYHSVLSVAAKLLVAMPVVHRKGSFDDEPLEDWLRRHALTREDGRWLADRRDPSPFKRRGWTDIANPENWRWSLGADDFLDALLHQSPHPQWLCLWGHWTECKDDRIEKLNVSSAFVTPATANALANSLRGCDPMDYRLPYYKDRDAVFENAPFQLIGWIFRGQGTDKRLDGFDPFAREISFPPYEIGALFAEALGVTPDYEKRVWRRSAGEQPLFVSELWSESELDDRDKPYREGARICGSWSELARLCSQLKKELIFSVEINRSLHRYRGSSSDGYACIPASHKIFILSANGTLRES